MPTPAAVSPTRTHLDIHDRPQREALIAELGVTEDALRRAVRLVGNRLTTLRSHLRR